MRSLIGKKFKHEEDEGDEGIKKMEDGVESMPSSIFVCDNFVFQ